MEMLLGLLGALIGALVFAIGFVLGRVSATPKKQHSVETADISDEQLRLREVELENQKAFTNLMQYSADIAYGIESQPKSI